MPKDDDSTDSNHKTRVLDIVRLLLPLLICVVFALFWRYTDAGQSSLAYIRETFAGFDPGDPRAFPVVLLVYVITGFVSIPLNAVILATAILFGAFPGIPYALAGSMTNALVMYYAGKRLGGSTARRLLGKRMQQVENFLERTGSGTIALLRLVPITPFAVANLACGAAGVRLRHYSVGTLLGLLPGVVLIGFSGSQLLAFLKNPGMANTTLLIVAVIFLVLLFTAGRYILTQLRRKRENELERS